MRRLVGILVIIGLVLVWVAVFDKGDPKDHVDARVEKCKADVFSDVTTLAVLVTVTQPMARVVIEAGASNGPDQFPFGEPFEFDNLQPGQEYRHTVSGSADTTRGLCYASVVEADAA